MTPISRKVNCLLILWSWCVQHVICVEDSAPEGQRTVDDFLRQLANFFSRSSPGGYFPQYQEKDLNTDYLNAINNHFDNLPANPSKPDTGYPSPNGAGFGLRPRPPQRPPYYPSGSYPSDGNYGPDLDYQLPPPQGSYPNRPRPGSFPPRPPGPDSYPRPPGHSGFPPPPPPGYRPPLGAFPQTSFVGALGSIAKYDDLRCVPRLLCEVTSGGRKANSDSHKNSGDSSPGSLISRDAIITLLTVLNFVDDSPVLLFARAAFLGYSSKGDTGACLTAYPTCPRDPNQLVNYLNNHNGGFFRFFNQQLQQQSQYQPYAQTYADTSKSPNQSDYKDHRFSPRYPQKQGINSRILNDPIDIEYVSSRVTNTPVRHRPQKVIFQTEEQQPDDQPQESSANLYNSVNPSRRGKKLTFPGGPEKPYSSTMIFPDRTGTGNLILSSDVSGHYKIVFANEEYINRKSRKIKFQPDSERSETRMKFPEDE